VKAVYAWHGEDANIPQCQKYGITRVLFPANDVQPFQIQHARTNGLEAGIYTNPQWYSFPDPKAYRDKITAELKRLADAGVNTAAIPIQINNEVHDPEYMLRILFWYRRSYRQRSTSWCPEGYQGGWIGPGCLRTSYVYAAPGVGTVTLTGALLAGVEIVPQAYDGAMHPYDPHDVVKDLVDWGVPYQSVTPIVGGEYAAWTSRRANQYLYLQSRLP
jgi:hypothetical protein